MLDRIILGLLLYRSLSIYEIKKAIEGTVGFFYSSSYGNIQPSLKKLEKHDLVNTEQKVVNGRNRKEYIITEKGREQFMIWLSQEINIGKIQDEGLLHLFFLAELSKKNQIELLRNYAGTLKRKIAELEQVEKEIKKIKVSSEHKEAFYYRAATLDFGIQYYHFELKWYENLIQNVEKRRYII
jgi:PadR family transcriptional regulator AphA